MTAPAVHRMSRVDTSWLRMDNDVNLMMIVGVWLLSPAISLAALRERIATRFLQYERFRHKAVIDVLGARWVEDLAFDLQQHVIVEPLQCEPGQTERAALQQLCGDLVAKPLDPDRPLWQFHLIERYEDGCAIVVRIHHCIGDGIALVSVMNSMTDGGVDPPKHRSPRLTLPEHAAHDGDWLSEAVLRPFTAVAVKALNRSGHGMAAALDLLAHPKQPLQDGADRARTGLHVLADLAALALMTDDSPTRLKGQPLGRKVVAWGEPMPLDVVKAVGQSLNCSINDVLLACVSGAIGAWLMDQGDDPTGAEIRAMVPVNLRPLDQAWRLGNCFGLAPLLLPIGIANPVDRVYLVRARMGQLKGSFQPLLAYGVLAATGMLAKPVQDLVLGLFSKKTTAVMTNVPGPRELLSLCGSTLRQSMVWVPASGNVGVGVSILSYGGGVQFSLVTDAALCADPQDIIDRFQPEFEKLLLLSLMLPWGDDAAAGTGAGPGLYAAA